MATDYNYVIPGVVPAIAQPSENTCWATAATMLVSWRDQASYAIEQVMDAAGSEKENFLFVLGFQGEQPMNYTVDGLLSLLQSYGPLWITTEEEPFSVHARILIATSGNGSVDGTFLEFIDPVGGQTYDESFRQFGQKFEALVDPDYSLRVQIVYCPTSTTPREKGGTGVSSEPAPEEGSVPEEGSDEDV
ncbi:MAG: papain-like cysteine protease family protein [Ktedonobacteraceae bacterium]